MSVRQGGRIPCIWHQELAIYSPRKCTKSVAIRTVILCVLVGRVVRALLVPVHHQILHAARGCRTFERVVLQLHARHRTRES